jgi:hydroxymethylpyrimidine/phosphomethylpyrimidine kinase
MRPKLLIVGHVDPTGRHGIAAGMRAAEALGVEPLPVVTAYALGEGATPEAIRPVWGGTIARQLAAALEQEPEAALVGTVSRARHARLIGDQLATAGPSATVLAPMPSSFDVTPLIPARVFAAVRRFLVPEARAVVIAASNVGTLVGRDGDDLDALRSIGQELLDMGAGCAWIRATPNESRRVDVFVDAGGPGLLDYQPAKHHAEPHTAAASLAALLALGTKMREAVGRAHRHADGLDRDPHAL